MDKLLFQDEMADGVIETCAGMMTTLVGFGGRVKSAASEVFPRTKLAEYRPPDGKFMIHAVAMGAEEAYGPNKNGDAFSKQALMDKHHTFVSNGHMFREHRNRDPEKRIGEIKASAYHPHLHRVELVLWGDMEKAAKEYETLKAGKQLDFSMSCRVPYDVCSCCEKKAKSTADYCSDLADHMLQWMEEFQKYAYAQNPDPAFFDMSAVENRADRIARYLQADLGMRKAAAAGLSFGSNIPSAEWAKLAGVQLPVAGNVKLMKQARRELLAKLARAEAELEQLLLSKQACATDWLTHFKLHIACNAFKREHGFKQASLSDTRNLRPSTFFRELGQNAAILPPDVLWAWINDKDPEQLSRTTKSAYTRVFRDLHAEVERTGGCGNLTDVCDVGSAVTAETDPEHSHSTAHSISQLKAAFSLLPDAMQERAHVILGQSKSAAVPFNTLVKSAHSLSEEDQMLKALYGCYKLAAVESIQELHPELDEAPLIALAIGQNFQFAMS